MAEQDGQASQWLPLAEAAPILRTTVDGLRKQIRRGKREGRRANSGQWLVLVQPEQDRTGRTAEPSVLPTVDSGADRLAAVQAELAKSRTELDSARTELTAVQAELTAALARLDERDRWLVHFEGEVAFLRTEMARRRWPGLRTALVRFWRGEG